MAREMTADELRRFEEEKIHHRDETEPDGGPASDAEVTDDRHRPSADPEVPPLNPD
jgi:hypothetical protein